MLPFLFTDTGATSQDGSHSAIFRMQRPEGCALPGCQSSQKIIYSMSVPEVLDCTTNRQTTHGTLQLID